MTREQLDAIRARAAELGTCMTETTLLLAEVERMRESCTGLVKQNERQYDEVLRLTAEVERLQAREDEMLRWRDEWEILKAAQKASRESAFKRGAAAMRDALLQRFDWHGDVADRIRAEPVPENK